MRQSKFYVLLLLLACATGLEAKRICCYFYFDNYQKHVISDENVVCYFDRPKDKATIALYIENKTDKIIYVDRGNCFTILNGKATNLFSNSAKTEGYTHNHGVSVNVGSIAQGFGVNSPVLNGINVGNNNGTIDQTTIYEKRVIPVAPHSWYCLYEFKDPYNLMVYLGNIIDKLQYNSFTTTPRARYIEPGTTKKIKLKKGFTRTYDETNTPINVKGIVTYSFTEDIKEQKQITADNYLKAFVVDSYKGWYDYNEKNAPYCKQFINNKEYYCWERYKQGYKLNDWEKVGLYVVLVPAVVVGGIALTL